MEKGKKKGYIEQRSGKVRVNSSLPPELYDKLDTLACACGVSATTLLNQIAELALGNENVINYLQDKYKNRSRFRVIPSRVEGDLKYIITEKKKSAL